VNAGQIATAKKIPSYKPVVIVGLVENACKTAHKQHKLR